MEYRALSQKLIKHENARFCPAVLTEVKAPENAAHPIPQSSMDLRDFNGLSDTRYMLMNGPKIPTTEDTVQSR